jgi:hypothetical protein
MTPGYMLDMDMTVERKKGHGNVERVRINQPTNQPTKRTHYTSPSNTTTKKNHFARIRRTGTNEHNIPQFELLVLW